MANLEKPEHLGYFVGRFNVYRATSNHIEGKAIFNYMLKKKWYQRPIRMKVIANKDSKWKKPNCFKCGRTWMTKLQLFCIWLVKRMNQSQSKVEFTKAIPLTFHTQSQIVLNKQGTSAANTFLTWALIPFFPLAMYYFTNILVVKLSRFSEFDNTTSTVNLKFKMH